MQVFYAPGISGNEFILDLNESRHVVRVLRMKEGSEVKLIDGRGNLYEGVIGVADQKRCLIRVTGVRNEFEKRNYRLHIAISPLKNPDRFEWFVEKAVEIGVDEITPLLCRNSEKTGIKAERINNIIVSAMKQSLKAYGTVLNEPALFSEFVKSPFSGIKMIPHCNSLSERKSIGNVYHPGQDAIILIGPEGDFSRDEIDLASGNGYSQVHMGNSRLRSETAGVAACYSVYFINHSQDQ
ncbi:MAG TPA: 16S rRNA (uracil(1498)-N(3))-methyltransferase [Bacteroidales bacterium]|nr:16S rRNA (uracil(1498)-N(3))-methyltransferase [Bacteroidales bacterium]